MSLTELAELIRHVDLNSDDKAAVTRLRAQLRASDSNELDERQGFHQARDCFDSAFRSAASLSAISLRSSL